MIYTRHKPCKLLLWNCKHANINNYITIYSLFFYKTYRDRQEKLYNQSSYINLGDKIIGYLFIKKWELIFLKCLIVVKIILVTTLEFFDECVWRGKIINLRWKYWNLACTDLISFWPTKYYVSININKRRYFN